MIGKGNVHLQEVHEISLVPTQEGDMAIKEIQEDITLSQEQAKVMEVGETKGALDYNHKTFCFGI
jgi:hypothetical protein